MKLWLSCLIYYSNTGKCLFLFCFFHFQYFVANKNFRDAVRQYLNPRIRARYLRFVPVTWRKWICMRVEVFGCDAGESKSSPILTNLGTDMK